MTKRFLIPIVVALLGVILLSGCAAGVAPEDFTEVQGELTTTQSELTAAQNKIKALEVQVASLSAISAYTIWYDQYYAVGNYIFADAASFNEKLGALIEATGDSASETAWNTYLAAENALIALREELPENSSVWTEEHYNKWVEATTARYNAFGEVGTALFNTTNFATSQIRILELEEQVASLSAISAYNIWYDQYYAVGSYVFADAASFRTNFGTLIEATGDSASETAWNTYLAAENALIALLAELPADYETWTEEQSNKWSEATTVSYDAFGEVGTALFNAIVQY